MVCSLQTIFLTMIKKLKDLAFYLKQIPRSYVTGFAKTIPIRTRTEIQFNT